MGTNLYWRPVQAGHDLDDTLKFIFKSAGYFRGSDKCTLTSDDVSFLKGINLASNDKDVITDVEILMEAIKNHGEVEIYLS